MRRSAMKPVPVTLDELDAYLSADDAPEDCMLLSDLDGFLTALVVGPAFIHPEIWMPKVWGNRSRFQDPDLKDRAIAAILSRYNEISRQLAEEPDQFAPLYWRHDDGRVIAGDWAEGFYDAMKLNPEGWQEILVSPQDAQLLLPILIYCDDERGKSLLGFTPEQEQALIADAHDHIPEAVVRIREFFMPKRVASLPAPKRRGARRPQR